MLASHDGQIRTADTGADHFDQDMPGAYFTLQSF
jgi:hypothetical protein